MNQYTITTSHYFTITWPPKIPSEIVASPQPRASCAAVLAFSAWLWRSSWPRRFSWHLQLRLPTVHHLPSIDRQILKCKISTFLLFYASNISISVHMCIDPLTFPPICLPTYLPTYLSLSICLFVSIHGSIHLPVNIYRSSAAWFAQYVCKNYLRTYCV